MILRVGLLATILLASVSAALGQARQASTSCKAIQRDSLDGAEHQQRVLAINGACLEVLEFGGQGRLLVLMPGYGNNAHIFDDLAATLTDQHRVVALTPRGFPPSSAPPRGYTIGQLADDVAIVMDSLGTQSAILGGHSISGAVITEFGRRHRPRLTAAIYLDAAFDFGPAIRRSRRPGRPVPGDSASPAIRAWVRRYDYWSNTVVGAVDSERRYWEQVGSVEADRRRALTEPLVTEVRARPHEPWRVTAPILALCAVGTYDRAFGWLTPDSARWGAAKAHFDDGALEKRSECDRVKEARAATTIQLDSGHYVFFDQREQVVREIRSFLARVAP